MASVTLPRILLVDNEIGWKEAEQRLVCRNARLLPSGADPMAADDPPAPLAEVAFCSGQKADGKGLENSYELIAAAVTADRGGADAWALVLLDVRFESGPPNPSGLPTERGDDARFGEEVRRRLQMDFPTLPILMFSSLGQSDLTDTQVPYLSKEGLDRYQLALALLEHGRLSREQERAILQVPTDIVAESPAMRHVLRESFRVAPFVTPVLLLGETGVGKEIVAKYIHDSSQRSKGAWIAFNVAAVPSELIESELFGHERGAFTGASAARIGMFESATGGTLLLDEIGDLSAPLQPKLLRVLQDFKVRRLGGSEIDVDVRLISATSRDLDAMRNDGRFREDLYRRVSGHVIRLPALRDRPEDIVPMARAFLARFQAESGKLGITLSREAETLLSEHSYPGNVGELQNVVTRLVVSVGNNRVISGKEAAASLRASGATRATPARTASTGLAPLDAATAVGNLSLDALLAQVQHARLDPLDRALTGSRGRVEAALGSVLRRLAGACLERARDPATGVHNRQGAMRILTGDTSLKGKGPQRVINEMLGRPQDADVTEADLDLLVDEWRHGSVGVSPSTRAPETTHSTDPRGA